MCLGGATNRLASSGCTRMGHVHHMARIMRPRHRCCCCCHPACCPPGRRPSGTQSSSVAASRRPKRSGILGPPASSMAVALASWKTSAYPTPASSSAMPFRSSSAAVSPAAPRGEGRRSHDPAGGSSCGSGPGRDSLDSPSSVAAPGRPKGAGAHGQTGGYRCCDSTRSSELSYRAVMSCQPCAFWGRRGGACPPPFSHK